MQVHRFHNTVALSTTTATDTAYLTPEQARWLAKHLLECADDIEARPKFSESQFTTATDHAE